MIASSVHTHHMMPARRTQAKQRLAIVVEDRGATLRDSLRLLRRRLRMCTRLLTARELRRGDFALH